MRFHEHRHYMATNLSLLFHRADTSKRYMGPEPGNTTTELSKIMT